MCEVVNYMWPWCVVTTPGHVVTRIADLSARYEIPDVSTARGWKERRTEENIHRFAGWNEVYTKPAGRTANKEISERCPACAPTGEGKLLQIPPRGMRDGEKKSSGISRNDRRKLILVGAV